MALNMSNLLMEAQPQEQRLPTWAAAIKARGAQVIAPLLGLMALSMDRAAHGLEKMGRFDAAKWARDESAAFNMGRGFSIAGLVVGAVVVILIIAALLPTFLSALTDANTALTGPNATTGDTTADSLLPVFGLIVALAGVFGIVGLIIAAVKLKS